MGGFANPYPGQVPERKMSKSETVRAFRLNIAAEEEATHLYAAQADAVQDSRLAAILRSVADEEVVHVGEFQRAIEMLEGSEGALVAKGEAEADERFKKPEWQNRLDGFYDAPGLTVSEAYRILQKDGYEVSQGEFEAYWKELHK